jgi:hypothetical protein
LRANIRREAWQPLPDRFGPLARADNTPCCHDCQTADTLVALDYVPTWEMARTVVANDRQEQLRLPGAPMGLVQMGLMRPSQEGDLDRHHAWLNSLTFGEQP